MVSHVQSRLITTQKGSRERFEALLEQAGVKQTDPRIMKHLLTTFAPQLTHIRNVKEALDLYRVAESMPKTETRLIIEKHANVRIAGPIS